MIHRPTKIRITKCRVNFFHVKLYIVVALSGSPQQFDLQMPLPAEQGRRALQQRRLRGRTAILPQGQEAAA